jgi:hypothetical protein
MSVARWLCVVVVVALVLPTLSAQEPAKPGPELDVLKKLEGSWDTTMKVEGKESKGTVVYKMELGGLWLTGALESNLFGQKFSGRSLDTFDAAKKKYTGIWVDSMGTAPVLMEGTYDKEKQAMTMAGEGPGMDGKPAKYRSVTKFSDANTVEMTMFIGDTKEPSFTIIYKRKK